MPVYEYECAEHGKGCSRCRAGFSVLRSLSDPPLAACPECGCRIRKRVSMPVVGRSASGMDDRAKHAGFHKLKRTGKGEFEKLY
jgi:putative FmdB family regulatory protein